MANKKEVAAATTETTVTNPEIETANLPAVVDTQSVALAESFGDVSFEFENENQIVEVTAAYLSMKEGDQQNFIFTGMSTTEFADDNAELQMKDIITLLDKDRNSFISASTVLVSACKRIKQVPCLIRIIHKGEVKMTGGRKYDNFAMLTSPVNL